MQWLFTRRQELNWHIGQMNREIERLPYLFPVQWPKLSLEQQQKLIGLLVRKIEVTSLSPHWIQLTVHWIGAVSPHASMRPDPALIWRFIPAHLPPIEDWELALLKQRYSLTQRREDLLSQLPLRTWQALSKQAHLLHLKKPYQRFPDDDIPEYACWNDVCAIPDRQEALRMIRDAKMSCPILPTSEPIARFGFFLLTSKRSAAAAFSFLIPRSIITVVLPSLCPVLHQYTLLPAHSVRCAVPVHIRE